MRERSIELLCIMTLFAFIGCSGSGDGVAPKVTINAQKRGITGTFIDVDGDGNQDLLVGAPDSDNARGKVIAYAGSASGITSTVLWSEEGVEEGDEYGYQVANLGDVNDDGEADFAVSAIRAKGATPLSGAVYVYEGGVDAPPALLATLKGNKADDVFGWDISGGDLDGDGINDIIVSALLAWGSGYQKGTVNIYKGAGTIDVNPSKVLNIAGSALATGDVGKDGIDDLIVGIGNAVQVYYGAAGFVFTKTYKINGAAEGGSSKDGSGFGNAIAYLGDINADGAGDLAVGQPRKSNDPTLTDEKGSVYVFKGYTANVANYYENTAARRLAKIEGSTNGERFGSSLAVTGDVDSGGKVDLIVGSEWGTGGADGTVKAAGAAYLYSMEDLLDAGTVLYSKESDARRFSVGKKFGSFSEGLANGPGTTFFAGAPNADYYSGAVYVFDAADGTSTEIGGAE